jgi:bifunctional non-homologous end joining protein LigD
VARRSKPILRTVTRRSSPRRKTPAAALPPFVEPELATLVDRPPIGTGWLHEMKFDGYRLICRLDGGKVRLFTRSGLDWTPKFRSIAECLAGLPARAALIDGEAVVMNQRAVPSFSALQQALSEGRHDRIRLFAFDLLHQDGADLRERPLVERKAALLELLADATPSDRVMYSEHFEVPGSELFNRACELGLEGIISKRRDAPYRSGRARDWVKAKCKKGQELVIGGYTRSDKAGQAFKSLLLGAYDGERLRYAGHVGTGFTVKVAADLLKRMLVLRSDNPTMEDVPRPDRRRAIWVRPELVCEVEFTERTADGELRHPSFKGLRFDKAASEVRIEQPSTATSR